MANTVNFSVQIPQHIGVAFPKKRDTCRLAQRVTSSQAAFPTNTCPVIMKNGLQKSIPFAHLTH